MMGFREFAALIVPVAMVVSVRACVERCLVLVA